MKKGWLIVIAVIIVVGGGAFWFLNRNSTAKAQVIIPTTVVQKGSISSDVTGSGDLTPAVDENIVIGSGDASKTVSSVNVANNATVKKGTALITYTDGTTLTAPADGTISNLSLYAGDRVSPGRAAAHLTNYSDLNMVAQIDELDIPKLKDGQAVTVTVNAYPNQKFTGTVTSIANAGTDTNGVATFNVTIHMNQSSGLKAGMTATADVVIQKKDNTLYISSGAVHQQGGQSFVYVSSSSSGGSTSAGSYGGRMSGVDHQLGTRVNVTTGLHNDQSIEILSGLRAGEVVQLPAITRAASASTTTTGTGGQLFGGTNGGGFRSRLNGGQGNGSTGGGNQQ
ncbi:efflux RND transporter periplasmic adaptor subunit [Sporolactobacillus sp. KGMB 08714]|uniref:efflux RND transporter periplasmic adaptor subunit n=1 Tax=Sporolactobacillus sp. KGMB 08714 TaxID=3064704 RepID=UPI002FBD41FF